MIEIIEKILRNNFPGFRINLKSNGDMGFDIFISSSKSPDIFCVVLGGTLINLMRPAYLSGGDIFETWIKEVNGFIETAIQKGIEPGAEISQGEYIYNDLMKEFEGYFSSSDKSHLQKIKKLIEEARGLSKKECQEKKKVWSSNPYIRGILEGYVHNVGFRVNTNNPKVIHSLHYDIRYYVLHYLPK